MNRNIQPFIFFVRSWSLYESSNLFFDDHFGNDPIDGGGNPMEMKTFLIIFCGLVILVGAVLFYHQYLATRRMVNSLDERVKKLESANRKRMPYDAFESILDARAALNKEKEEFKFFVSLIENAEGHLDKAMTTGTKREEE